jgi:hypothetical protein
MTEQLSLSLLKELESKTAKLLDRILALETELTQLRKTDDSKGVFYGNMRENITINKMDKLDDDVSLSVDLMIEDFKINPIAKRKRTYG